MNFADFGLDFKNPCFCKYAESYSAQGHRLEQTDQLVPLMQQCINMGGVHLIDVPVDYSDNDRILNKELPERSQTI